MMVNLKLKARIVERFETQSRFAQALGVSESIVSEVVRGRRNLEDAEQLRWRDLLGNTISFIEPRTGDGHGDATD